MSLGFKIKRLREENNLTQSELGEKLNISKATISKYETDKVEPSIPTLISMSKLFNVSIDFLVGNEENFETIAAHSDDRTKNLTDEQKKQIDNFIDFILLQSSQDKNE